MAAALFAEVPSSTFEEALEHFMAAEKLRPSGWKENRLFIAKCYILMSDFSLASAWLEQAASAPSVTPDVGCGRYLSVGGREGLLWHVTVCCELGRTVVAFLQTVKGYRSCCCLLLAGRDCYGFLVVCCGL